MFCTRRMEKLSNLMCCFFNIGLIGGILELGHLWKRLQLVLSDYNSQTMNHKHFGVEIQSHGVQDC